MDLAAPNSNRNHSTQLHALLRVLAKHCLVITNPVAQRPSQYTEYTLERRGWSDTSAQAVDSRRPSLAAARLFIQRDNEILKKRESEGTANLVETLLDVIDKVGNSVYRHHLATKEKKRSISLERDIKRQTVPSVRKTSNKSEKQPILDRGREEIGQKHPSSPTLPLQKADIRTASSMQLIEKQEKSDERSGKQATAQEWNKILKELKLHYMRTRNAVMAISFLHGSNMNG